MGSLVIPPGSRRRSLQQKEPLPDPRLPVAQQQHRNFDSRLPVSKQHQLEGPASKPSALLQTDGARVVAPSRARPHDDMLATWSPFAWDQPDRTGTGAAQVCITQVLGCWLLPLLVKQQHLCGCGSPLPGTHLIIWAMVLARWVQLRLWGTHPRPV